MMQDEARMFLESFGFRQSRGSQGETSIEDLKDVAFLSREQFIRGCGVPREAHVSPRE